MHIFPPPTDDDNSSRLETEMGLACTAHFGAKSLRDVAATQLQIANDGERNLLH